MAKISIIIPVYNAVNYLRLSLDSVINQTLKDIDVWLVNDGSKDNSLEICKEYADKDSRIHIIDQPNGGAGKARDAGIMACDSEFIGFVDSDDWVDNEMFATMIGIADRYNVDIVRCNTLMHQYGKITERWRPPFSNRILTRNDITSLVIPSLIAPENERDYNNRLLRGCVSCIFKRSLAVENNIHFSDLKSGEDVLFTMQMMLKARNMYIINDPFYHYMFYSNNTLSRSRTSAGVNGQRERLRGYIRDMVKHTKGKEIVEQRFEQEDRRMIYLDARIISVFSDLNYIEAIRELRKLLNSQKSITAFAKPINKSLPLQMYVLYYLIKHHHSILLFLAIKIKLRNYNKSIMKSDTSN